jgi:hypothetical protein
MFESDKIMFEIYQDKQYNQKYRVVYYTELNENNKHAEINRALQVQAVSTASSKITARMKQSR